MVFYILITGYRILLFMNPLNFVAVILKVLLVNLLAALDFALQATCQFCCLPLTVNHILLECANLNTVRQRFFRVSSLKDLFDSIDNQIIIDSIKETHFYAIV